MRSCAAAPTSMSSLVLRCKRKAGAGVGPYLGSSAIGLKVLTLPICNHCAIQRVVIVLSVLNCLAMSNFPGAISSPPWLTPMLQGLAAVLASSAAGHWDHDRNQSPLLEDSRAEGRAAGPASTAAGCTAADPSPAGTVEAVQSEGPEVAPASSATGCSGLSPSALSRCQLRWFRISSQATFSYSSLSAWPAGLVSLSLVGRPQRRLTLTIA